MTEYEFAPAFTARVLLPGGRPGPGASPVQRCPTSGVCYPDTTDWTCAYPAWRTGRRTRRWRRNGPVGPRSLRGAGVADDRDAHRLSGRTLPDHPPPLPSRLQQREHLLRVEGHWTGLPVRGYIYPCHHRRGLGEHLRMHQRSVLVRSDLRGHSARPRRWDRRDQDRRRGAGPLGVPGGQRHPTGPTGRRVLADLSGYERSARNCQYMVGRHTTGARLPTA